MNRLLRSGMRHSPDLLRDKRRSAELRAKYGYFRHIWLAERPRAATVPVQWQVLLLSTWPSGIRQSLAHGLDRVLRAIEQVMYPLVLIGLETASACRKRLENQLRPARLSRLLSVARQRQGPKNLPGLWARTWNPGSRCMRHRCPSSWSARRRRSELGDRQDGRSQAPDSLPWQSGPSLRHGRAAPFSAPIGRVAVGRRERSPELRSSRLVHGQRRGRDHRAPRDASRP